MRIALGTVDRIERSRIDRSNTCMHTCRIIYTDVNIKRLSQLWHVILPRLTNLIILNIYHIFFTHSEKLKWNYSDSCLKNDMLLKTYTPRKIPQAVLFMNQSIRQPSGTMKFSPGKALLRDIIQFSHLAFKRIELSCLIDFYHRKNPYHCAHGQRLGIKVSSSVAREIYRVCLHVYFCKI